MPTRTTSFTFLAIIIGFALTGSKSDPEAWGRPSGYQQPTVRLTASPDEIFFAAKCPPGVDPFPDCKPTDSVVTLTAVASGFDSGELLYKYTTDDGRIIGDGPEVSWDLSEVRSGTTYTATVEVSDEKTSAKASVTVTVTACECIPQPTPSPISIAQFTWPPPDASTRAAIPVDMLLNSRGTTLLRDVSSRLEASLRGAGFTDSSWYAVPAGFALVTRFEQFRDQDGRPVRGKARWVVTAKPPAYPGYYLEYLFTSVPGRYRVFVFIVTKYPFSESDREVTFDEVKKWYGEGADALPEEIGRTEFSVRDGYKCTALIYEYVKPRANSAPRFVGQSAIQGQGHLEMAGIWGGIRR